MQDLPMWIKIVLAGTVVTYLWRMLGVMLISRLDPQGAMMLWVRAVATALVAGLVMRLMILPSQMMSVTTLTNRLSALFIGLVVLFTIRRNTTLAVFSAVLAFMLMAWLQQG